MLKEKDLYLPEYFGEILNAISDGILISDSRGVALWVNQSCLNLINRSREEIIGKSSSDLEEMGIFNPSVTSMVLKEKTMVSTVQSTENKRQFMVSGHPIKSEEGEIELIITHSRDITGTVRTTSKLEEMQALLKKYSQEIMEMKRRSKKEESNEFFVGKSKASLSMINLMDKAALVDTTVLITGETGVGKSEIAGKIHQLSERSQKPLVEINCGALPDSLIESELFGYKKGAFTGADKGGKKGLIAQADGGTLFLDEIGELPIHLQAKLLQFLQQKKYTPIGDTKSYIADVRIVAATNRNLQLLVSEGAFRSDLYYRLNVLPIKVPSLRERQEDIFHLLQLNLNKFNQRYDRQCKLSSEAFRILQSYHWPGNIRELENLLERVVITAPTSEITSKQLSTHFHEPQELPLNILEAEKGQSLTETLEKIERKIIEQAYEKYDTTRKTALELGISQSLLMRRLKKYELTKK
ncbi:sigma-54 interaction domain-containing protein [Pseudobacillus badius]|uniref:sigma-54 interaction domain-containing protein n=1 Tax=Bacillus badius TaxID=1455 RepID=UPI0007B37E9C|nr:sigma 54-interacting transcriptional regulator [Bacillus badius]KZR56832.1 transcriptional regulator [Bacillus badius]